MCFIAARPYPSSSKLCIELKTPYLDDAVHFEGIVLGTDEKVAKLIYEVHFEFDKLTPIAQQILQRMIDYFKNK